jgi:hypothetical protein
VATTIIRKFSLQANPSHKHTYTYIQTNPNWAFIKKSQAAAAEDNNINNNN